MLHQHYMPIFDATGGQLDSISVTLYPLTVRDLAWSSELVL